MPATELPAGDELVDRFLDFLVEEHENHDDRLANEWCPLCAREPRERRHRELVAAITFGAGIGARHDFRSILAGAIDQAVAVGIDRAGAGAELRRTLEEVTGS